MSTKSQNARIIFGLKARQLRQERQLSFAVLAKQAGMSVSYLNEIEKGKKYPKEDKLEALARALEIPVSELTSSELPHKLAPLGDLLSSNFLNEMPLDLFSIDLSKVVEIIANAPTRVSAFISTLVELSRNYALAEENFYFGVLRSYLELHNNYFEEIEREVKVFTKKYQLPTKGKISTSILEKLLQKQYGYKVLDDGLKEHPELKNLRSVFLPQKKELLLNGNLTEIQKTFQLGKELGFNHLKLKERANTSSLIWVNSFEEVLNHFKANYFSASLLINQETFVEDIKALFEKEYWNGETISNLMQKYQASPEMFLQRMTNLLPQYLGLENIFILRFIHTPAKDAFRVDKELHLGRHHHPHSNGLHEHYCRRWQALSLLKDLYKMQQEGKYVGTIVGAQRSKYFETEDEYLCLTFARSASSTSNKNASVTIGILLNETSKEKVKFWNDPSITIREVNKTCERCPIKDCKERAVPPTVVLAREQRKKIQKALKEIGEN